MLGNFIYGGDDGYGDEADHEADADHHHWLYDRRKALGLLVELTLMDFSQVNQGVAQGARGLTHSDHVAEHVGEEFGVFVKI